MSFTTGRTVRLSALALATGTLVATVASSAGAAPAKPAATPLFSYAGNTGTSVIAASVNLPATLSSPLSPVLSALGVSDGSLDISLLNSVGSLQHDAAGKIPDIATSTTSLAGGTLFDKGGALASLNQTVTSTLASPGVKTSSNLLGLPSNLAGILDLGLPSLKVQTVTGSIQTLGSSEVAGLNLGKLTDLLPTGTLDALTSELTDLGTTAASGAQQGTGTLIDTINGLLGQLGAAGAGAVTAPVQNVLTQVKTLVTGLTDEVPTIISNLEDGSIVSVDGITTTQDVKTVGGTQISTVGNKLASVDILGGLFHLDGFDNSVTTMAGGTAGTAKVIAQPNVAKVTVGTNNELQLVLGNITTLSGTIPGIISALPDGSSVAPQLQSLLTQLLDLQTALNSVLNVAGVDISVDKVTTNDVAKDGSSAKAALSGLSITVDPALVTALAQKGSAVAAPGDPLVDIQIGAVDASSAAAVVNPARTVVGTTPTTPTRTQLPYTGADLPLTGGIAVLLLAGGAGLVIRRRRSGADL